jgi:CMP-N,N'-diacetyllegionaminic acid synthase
MSPLKKKYLALVLARKNSLRLKNKNILKLGNIPLIVRTFKLLARLNNLFVDIMVSSDSLVIKNYSFNYGFKFLKRPKNLATAKVSSAKAAIHAVNYYIKRYGKFDYVVLFQPTSPFRTKKTILKALNLSKKFPEKQIVSVNSENQKKIPNGVIYVTSVNKLKKYNSFSYKNFFPLYIPSKKETLDIDTIEDFKLAQNYVKFKNK